MAETCGREAAIATPACASCGRAAGPDDRFCGRCGSPIALICEQCGATHPADLSFCTACGHPLRAPSLPPGLEERRRVSVLFIDAVGFTPYSEQADPEQVRARQSAFFATVRRIVRQYGGVVEKFIGDAAMALFGAPVATESDAVRCVRAGLDLQAALAHDDAWSFRVGIATGEALVDAGAAHDGGQAIVAGDVVNMASRLQAESPPGGVLVDGQTYVATRAEIRFTPRESLTLRGRSSPTEVWLAEAPIQRRPAAPPTDEPRMVGRDHELSLLTSALDHVIAEREPRLVTVVGPPGIGKTRLVRELHKHAAGLAEPVVWRSGRCPPFGENVAYSALADVVQEEVGVLATDSPGAARDRLDLGLRDLLPDGESARLSDALRPLLGLPGSPLSADDAQAAWRRFVSALGRRGPTVLVLEDLHWADERMLRFVELIGATVHDVPLLVVCTARPELIDRAPGWAVALPGLLALSLSPLRAESIAKLYGDLFGAPLPDEVLRPLVELADGMPLYAQEYARMLIERGVLRQSDDRTWSIGASSELPMPESVHAVIANRIDLLDVAERTVLQAAAVVGARFWPGAVAAALATRVEVVEIALRTLVQRDLVREQPTSSMADEPEYRFRHVLVTDVCYERLPHAERVARHVRTADWLDTHLDLRSSELAELIAHHRYTAFANARALGHDARSYAGPALHALRQAAQRAVLLSAFDAAASHLGRAGELVDRRLDLGVAEADRLGVELLGIELRLQNNEGAFAAGDGAIRLTELATLLYRVGDHGGAARAWTLLGRVAWLRADRREALRCLDRAVELFDDWPDTPEKAQTYAELGRLHMLNYEHAPATGATQIAADIAGRLGLVELRANALITLGMCKFQAGNPDGLADLQEALEFCRVHRLPSLRRAIQSYALALREEGDHARFEQLLGPNTPADPPGESLLTAHSSEALRSLLAGDWDGFFSVADEVLADPSERDVQLRGVRGWMRALRGDPAGAVDDAQAAVNAARSTGLWRLTWNALAHGALTQALLRNRADSEALLKELGDGWRRMRAIASGDWVAAAAHAAHQLGPDAALLLRDALADAPHHTGWSRAALASVDATLAASRGDHATAARLHLDAADRYAAVGSQTDRAFAVAAAAEALATVGDPRADDVRRQAADFASRNSVNLLGQPRRT